MVSIKEQVQTKKMLANPLDAPDAPWYRVKQEKARQMGEQIGATLYPQWHTLDNNRKEVLLKAYRQTQTAIIAKL